MNSEQKTDLQQSKPARLSRRELLFRGGVLATLPVGGLAYAHEVEPFWPRYSQVTLPIAGLAKSFDGFRVAQLTDMHAGRVPIPYLTKVIQTVQDMKPDAVAVTGDLIHHDSGAIAPICTALSRLTMPVFVSYGNHEFGMYRAANEVTDLNLPDEMQAGLSAVNIPVLRNRAVSIDHADGKLWFVGLDDLWFGQFDPASAFERVPTGAASICLSHNPDTAFALDAYKPGVILAGHTHGGQIRIPGYGALRLNVAHPEFDMGLFPLSNTKLYVSAGVGYIRRIRFNCRPEVPTFTLKSV